MSTTSGTTAASSYAPPSWGTFFQPDELILTYTPKARTQAERDGPAARINTQDLLTVLRSGDIPAVEIDADPVVISVGTQTAFLHTARLSEWKHPRDRRPPANPEQLGHLGERMAQVWGLAKQFHGPNVDLTRFDVGEFSCSGITPNWIAVPHQ